MNINDVFPSTPKNSENQSPSWEAGSSSAVKKFSGFYGTSKGSLPFSQQAQIFLQPEPD
jgi:hypothetical protein